MSKKIPSATLGGEATAEPLNDASPETEAPVTAFPPGIRYTPVQTLFDPDVEPSYTLQSEAAACDINNIMAKYQRTGAIDHYTKYPAVYGYAPAIDFREALEIVQHGQTVFDDLPSSIRAKFDHDPAAFLSFASDPANKQALADLGLKPTEPATTVQAPPPSAPPAPSEGP